MSSAASDLRAHAQRAREAAILAAKPIPSWEGEGATAFASSVKNAHALAAGLEHSYSVAQGTLERYANTLTAQQATYADATQSFDAAARRITASPLDLGAYLDAAAAKTRALAAFGAVQLAAVQAARELDAAGGGPTPPGRPWWDPFGWFTDDSIPDWAVQDDLLNDDKFDPADLQQGQFGDCGLVSSVMSLMQTDDGDALLRKGLRWDADKHGYWVTLYINGEAKEYFVDNVFDQGAHETDGWWIFTSKKQTIASLYEAAYQQAEGEGALEGIFPADMLAAITGDKTYRFGSSNSAWTDGSVDSMDGLKQVVSSGGQVVGATNPSAERTPVQAEFENGDKKSVDVVGKHAYVVTKVESDGSVWIRNAWGPGNSADGGGVFKISGEDARRVFIYYDYRPKP